MSDTLRAGWWVALLVVLAALTPALVAASQPVPSVEPGSVAHSPVAEESSLREAMVSLPIAAVLGAALAFRPRRRGTPPRSPAVIQTQIILALVGALVMLVVGASLARAFGIVGAASLVRYRAKIEDPKDAGVMLSCLAIGLASGVGIYWVAGVSTLFILGVVWLLESLEPESEKDFLLKVKAKDSARAAGAHRGPAAPQPHPLRAAQLLPGRPDLCRQPAADQEDRPRDPRHPGAAGPGQGRDGRGVVGQEEAQQGRRLAECSC